MHYQVKCTNPHFTRPLFKVATVRKKSGKILVLISKSLKSQGILFEKTVQELTKEGYALATEAETKNKMDLLVKSNAMHSNSCKKRKEIKNEEKNIDGLQNKLKQM